MDDSVAIATGDRRTRLHGLALGEVDDRSSIRMDGGEVKVYTYMSRGPGVMVVCPTSMR